MEAVTKMEHSDHTCFGVFIDRPAGMLEIVVGQSRSVSVPRRLTTAESRMMVETPITDHLLIFVIET